jgi:hypothetical protein
VGVGFGFFNNCGEGFFGLGFGFGVCFGVCLLLVVGWICVNSRIFLKDNIEKMGVVLVY